MSIERFSKFLRNYQPVKKRRKFKQTLARRLIKRKWLASPRGKYWQQKTNARRRGIAWEFTFDSWWQFWQDSGKWEQRGDQTGMYCMGRKGDTGPYSPQNCEVMLFERNSSDSNVNYVRTFGRDAMPNGAPGDDMPF